MPLLLLLASAIVATISFIEYFIYALMEFIVPISKLNAVHILYVLTISSGITLHCVNLLTVEMFSRCIVATKKTKAEKSKFLDIF